MIKQEESLRLYAILEEALGTRVLELLKDPVVSEIRVNSDGKLWQCRLGEGKIDTGIVIDARQTKNAISAVAYSKGTICDEMTPHIGAELPGSGARFQGILPPVTSAPVIVIRKKAQRIFTLDDFVAQGVIDLATAKLLRTAVESRKNILVVGGTDSGKTTFANSLLESMRGSSHRIVIMEDTAELQCDAEEVEFMRTVDGVASLRDLVRIAMRMSPDRLIIGEVRGGEALDMLKAWNTGHNGGVSTVHASSARNGLSRIEQLVAETGAVPSRRLISEAIDLLVFMERVGTKRLVRELVSIDGFKQEEYELRTVWEAQL